MHEERERLRRLIDEAEQRVAERREELLTARRELTDLKRTLRWLESPGHPSAPVAESVVAALAKAGVPLTVREIMAEAHLRERAAQAALARLRRQGRVEAVGAGVDRRQRYALSQGR